MRRIHVGWRPLGDHVSAQRRGDFWAPTSARGLSGLPRAGQVLESSLIDALERQNHATRTTMLHGSATGVRSVYRLGDTTPTGPAQPFPALRAAGLTGRLSEPRTRAR